MNRTSAVLTLIVLVATATATWAAVPQEAVEIQPRFTRVFGTETLGIQNASLSPDGRWIVFSREEGPSTFNLWLVSAAGGEPVRLTRGAYSDLGPEWYPSGDRVLFRSNRPGDDEKVLYAMSVDVDLATGQPTGAPRQVTLDAVVDKAVSPDGRWLAYSAFDNETGSSVLKVVGSRGGSARTIANGSGFRRISWSADGERLLFLARDRATDREQRLERARVSDGSRETVALLRNTVTIPNADHSHYLQPVSGSSSAASPFTIHRATGEVIARVTLGRGMTPVEVRSDGTVLAVSREVAAPITIRPVQGGASWVVGNPRSYEWPIDWSPDGTRVLFSTQVDGHEAIMTVFRDGGAATQIDLSRSTREGPGVTRFTGDGRYLLYHADSPAGAEVASLVLQSLENGGVVTLTESAPRYAFAMAYLRITGPGGEPSRDGEAVLFIEQRGDQLAIVSARAGGERRTLWEFPSAEGPPPDVAVGVAKDRLAWIKQLDGGGAAVMIARVGDAEPRELLRHERILGELAWSRDGTQLCITSLTDASLLFAHVDDQGDLIPEPTVIQAPAAYFWDVRWVPGDQAVTMVGMAADQIVDSNIWMVPVDPSGAPVALTEEDIGPAYGYSLSPDGRFIAYQSEKELGSSLWLVDLGIELRAEGREDR